MEGLRQRPDRLLRVEGGRALHSFLPGQVTPVCGVVPERKDGTVSPWLSGTTSSAKSIHKECWRRLPVKPWLNRPMNEEEIARE